MPGLIFDEAKFAVRLMDHPSGTEDNMNELVERLRDRGWRMTAQRRVVAEVLAGEHVHLSAEAVHARAQAVLPEISLATVYNTLNDMVAMGEVLLVAAGGGPRRYDPNVGAAHQHLLCVSCGDLRDVTPHGDATFGLPDDQRHGFRLLDVDVVFRGLCPICDQKPFRGVVKEKPLLAPRVWTKAAIAWRPPPAVPTSGVE